MKGLHCAQVVILSATNLICYGYLDAIWFMHSVKIDCFKWIFIFMFQQIHFFFIFSGFFFFLLLFNSNLSQHHLQHVETVITTYLFIIFFFFIFVDNRNNVIYSSIVGSQFIICHISWIQASFPYQKETISIRTKQIWKSFIWNVSICFLFCRIATFLLYYKFIWLWNGKQ